MASIRGLPPTCPDVFQGLFGEAGGPLGSEPGPVWLACPDRSPSTRPSSHDALVSHAEEAGPIAYSSATAFTPSLSAESLTSAHATPTIVHSDA